MFESLLCEATARLDRKRAIVFFQLTEHRIVLTTGNNNRHVVRVLRRRTDHRRAADIDLFDRFCTGDTFPFDRFCKRVKIHHHHVDRCYPVLLHRGEVFIVITNREKSTVNTRMQRLDAAIHHLWKSCDVGDVVNSDACVAQCFSRSACADDFDIEFD